MIQIPIAPAGPHFSFSTELDGRTWRLTFRWNHRCEQWVMSIADGNGANVISGVRVVIDVPLMRKFRGRENTPKGEFVAVNTTGKQVDPGFEDLGRAVQLYYVTESELP